MPTTRSNKSSAAQEATATATAAPATTTSAPGTSAAPVPVTTVTDTSSGSTDTTTWTHGTTTTVTTAPERAAPAQATRAGSTAQSYSRRKRELEAKAEVAKLEFQAAQAAAAQVRAQLELLQLENEENSLIDDEPIDKNEDVSQWIQASVEAPGKGQLDMASPPTKATASNEEKSDTQHLADAIMKAIASSRPGTATPSFLHDLPAFDGNCGEWTAFRTVYEDTAPLFTSTQNMARLRKAIRGTARDAVKSALYSDCKPEDVLEALRRRFGRPDALILTELEKLKNLPRLNENARDVCIFASHVNNTVAAIRGLKKPQYLQSPEMLKHIVDKMPAVIRYRWYDFAADREPEEPDLLMMMKFLNREADRCGPYALQEAGTTRRQHPVKQATHTATEPSEKKAERIGCFNCGGEHRIYECAKFLECSVQARWELVKKKGLCFKCLRSRHYSENCRAPACKKCKRRHHVLLHEDQEEPSKEVTSNVRSAVNFAANGKAYLKMAPVVVYGPKGSKRILALLDEGSTVTLLDSAVAEEVGLHGPEEKLTLETVGGKIVTKTNSMKLNLKIRGIHERNSRSVTGARTIDDIHLAPQKIEEDRIRRCAHLKSLLKQIVYKEEPPKMLIGQDNWELVVSKSVKKGPRNQPVASYTLLGWVLHGYDNGNSKRTHSLMCAHVSTPEEKIDEQIREHFAIESLGVLPRRPTTDADGQALKILEETSHQLPDGRYEVGLLWKKSDEKLPNNFKSAETRLKTIEKKLDRDPELKADYTSQIENLLNSGYAEEADQSSQSDRKWYLPHFTVTHPTKKKRRLVFDAAAKCEGKSLNDVLMSGPDLLQSLFGVLLRFRQWPVAVAADIKEMFLQIKIKPEDRDSLRFLWRGDKRTGPPKEYRMSSLIFGAACSPSAAIFVKNKNASRFEEAYPEAARAVVRNHYMDDYLHSFKTREEATRVAKEVDEIHRAAKFELRGWVSNDDAVLTSLGQQPEHQEIELGSKEEKTLGLRWFTAEDKMGFRTNMRNVSDAITTQQKTPTKREVTSAVMSTFDPLGLAAPVLIQGKRLIQDIWKSGVGWDEHIKPEEERAWTTYLENVKLLKELKVPRCVSSCRHEGELHVFSDASETAYACAAYWRQQRSDGKYEVNLLAGKARVTPLKPISIPRLELQAALLATRVAQAIREELDLTIEDVTYWTDSSTVLSWIKTDPRTFKAFVAHRLAEIEDTTRPQQWRWVPTKHNPADDATRGVPKDFDKDHRWFRGPEFLQEEKDAWPQARDFRLEHSGEEKECRQVTAAVARAAEFATPRPEKFSKWTRLVRSTARVLQFVGLCRKGRPVNISRKAETKDPTWKLIPKKHGAGTRSVPQPQPSRRFLPLDPELIEAAELLLLKRCQEEDFGKEIGLLKQQKPLEKGSKLGKMAVVFEDGLLKMHGRIDAAVNMSKGYKRPVILDSRHHITKLIIQHYHEHFNHGNHATVVNELRQGFWVLGLRSAVRHITRQCQWCKVYRGAPLRPPTGDLPNERLRYGEPPFAHAAVDYFGPMTVTVGRRHEKRWGVLFTCLTTRAVHIELAPSLSTDSMILALRRMAARRGMPRTLFSDNGTNFVGANKELKEAAEELKNEELTEAADKLGVRWKFIPPGAPHMGGAWERLVRSVKIALAATLREKHPQEEVLHTLITEAEHVVNSRPLVAEEENPTEEALTPNHFLIGRSCGARRIGAFTDQDMSGRRSWRTAQRLADHFWNRWVREYLPTLLPRKIHGRTSDRDLRCGDVVLIVDSSLPRYVWPRGQIINVHQGPDGRTRVIEVRTTNGVLRRPSSKAVLLVPATSPGTGGGAAHEGEDVGDATSRIGGGSAPRETSDSCER